MTYRAVSLDFWFTAIFHPPEGDARYRDERIEFLQENLRRQNGIPLEAREIAQAMETVHARLFTEGKDPIEVDPLPLARAYVEILQARLVLPPEEFGRAFSAAGLSSRPPSINPECPALISSLEARKIPVIAITNSARRGSTWQEYLRSNFGVRFSHVVSSCDVGHAKPHRAIFEEAARRLGLPLGAILHVGDRLELDVEGARGAGCGAVLYTGLWGQYPTGMYPPTDLEPVRRSGTPCVERLDDLLISDLLPGPTEG